MHGISKGYLSLAREKIAELKKSMGHKNLDMAQKLTMYSRWRHPESHAAADTTQGQKHRQNS
jgi:hypothetical protein